MAADMIEKEKKIKDTEKLYMNLREILSKHPGPEVAISLNKTQKALRERGQKVKVNENKSPIVLLVIFTFGCVATRTQDV
ncbi:hypothetical protein K0M31_014594 [Melipona bicolor]|uniref:Uncharacterized protein n=1 Tax=Melipona bicolor TaxID=60889 RepID=A0AA40FGX0_9HYME|nr:hypothetical protein K0M31_014594 [Melipona bicolor]